MAYMGQDKKKQIVANLKVALKGTGLKYSVGVHNHSTLVLNIKSGPFDFLQNYIDVVGQSPRALAMPHMFEKPTTYLDVNPYWYHEQFSGKCLDVLKKIMTIMNEGNHNRSDIMSDYHDVGWYVDVNVGKWDKPYQLVK